MKVWMGAGHLPPEQLVTFAVRAEEVGFEGIAFGDHASNPKTIESEYPYKSTQGGVRTGGGKCLSDPFVVMAGMSTVTTRLRFTTAVLVVPLRHPILLAKEIATAARITQGRIELGIGIGWMKDEFVALGINPKTRARRMDEMIELMKGFWRGEFVSADSDLFQFEPQQVLPALADPLPIHVGGHDDPALRRAARMADGWISATATTDELRRVIAEITKLRAEYGRENSPFEYRMIVSERPTESSVRELAEIGVTSISLPNYMVTDNRDDPQSVLDGISRWGDEIRSWKL